MYAVGRLGSYISQGVYTVSGPFHPFGGAVDIIVIEQEDGSFKSSPWYVRFGKFQGVLKSKEKVVSICVEGVEAGFSMLLDNKGEAYFLREVDEEEQKSGLYRFSSVDETDRQPHKELWHMKSKSCNFDSFSGRDNPMDMSKEKAQSSRILGLFGRKTPAKDETPRGKEVNNNSLRRANSLKHAEMSADLMDLQWSTRVSSKEANEGNSSSIDKLDGKADKDFKTNGERCVNRVAGPNSRVTSRTCDGNSSSIGFEGRSAQQFLVQQSCSGRDTVLQGCVISQTNSRKNEPESSSNREMSDSSIVRLDDSSEQTSEDTHTENHCQQTCLSRPCTPERNEDHKNTTRVTESCSQIDGVDPVPGSVLDIEPRVLQPNVACDVVSQSSEEEQFLFGDLDEDKLNAVHTVEPKSPDHNDKESRPSFSLEGSKEMHKSVSTSYESYSSVDQFGRENSSVDYEKPVMKLSEISNPIGIPRTPKTPGVERLGESAPNMWFHVEDLNDSSSGCHSLSHSLDASPRSLNWTLLGKSDSNCLLSDAEREGQLGKELLDPKDAQISQEPNSATPRSGGLSFGSEQKIESEGTITVERVEKPIERDSSKPPAGRWRIWPFMFRTPRSENDDQVPPPGYVRLPDSEDAAESVAESAAESVVESAVESVAESVAESTAESVAESPSNIAASKSELRRIGSIKISRALTPTSEQLESLKLSEGKNSVTFTFSTGMLGDQQVDARIYLWKWNTRIVISDVDGTITKSDVLGQFMPMVGIDWCQTGVTQLFSAIKENGYQLLFLSARAIAQAYTTRQFLLNIKQDGKGLPDGPIVISPDGLFPSLFREVIRRAPHEFKIQCLEDIKALFPEDSNPFYAGFGNRDTDEISYLKVGIPMGKIFIINPKGEVAVNRRVDRKSYTSLHNLVHDMFPSTEPEQEDFNSWNFWKLPPPSLM